MAAPGENLRINGDRLWDSLMEMAKIGPGVAGGNNRQTVTDEDGEGRKLFQSWCEDAGCTMGVDTMGNMFMTREGADPEALPVYVGSHLDTQPNGGKYDGVLGVLADGFLPAPAAGAFCAFGFGDGVSRGFGGFVFGQF